RRAVRQAMELSGRDVEVVHLVGGGSRNELLCRLTADACGLPVVAGPGEATTFGNVLVQARAAGLVSDLEEMRALVASSQPLRRYEPSGDRAAWDEAASRVF
ncbi:FGGY-family carbohydrate kinase, partial [Nonomuraea sp. NPDC004297]